MNVDVISVVIYAHPIQPQIKNHQCIIPQDGQHPQRQHETAQAGPAAPAHRGETAAEEV